MSDHRCPNCGSPNFPKKEGEFCDKCGFQNFKPKELPPILLVFCGGCGYHRDGYCADHPRDKQKVVI